MTNLGELFSRAAYDGSLLLAIPIAMIAGLMSFFSPCVVPLLPGYLSYATGLSGDALKSGRRSKVVAGSVLFVLGFSVVFVAFGALFGALGSWLIVYARPISVVLGLVTVLVGLTFIGVVPWLQREWRVHRVPAVGVGAAPMLGVLFGLGWTPCIGPTLTAITALAVTEANAGRGALLGLAYCLGLGAPFVVAGLMYHRMLGLSSWVRRHHIWVSRTGGALLIAVGLLLVTGLWDLWVSQLRGWVGGYATPI